jgi:hypothetical protein
MMRRKLGRMETAQAISNDFHAFNVAAVLHLLNGPSAELLTNALAYLQRRHPLLGVHIEKEKKRLYFVSDGTPQIPLTVVERKGSDHWQPVAEEEINRKFDLFTGPLVRVIYLAGSGNEKESELIVTFQHSIVDAVSGVSFFHELLLFCSGVESGEAFEPLPSAECLFPPAFKGIGRKWKIFLFMLRQMGDEFLFQLRSMGKRKPPVHPNGMCKILPVTFSRELTLALSRASRKRRITLNSVLTAALLISVQEHLYDGQAFPVRYINSVDLRPYLVPPPGDRYFGSYFSMMRYTVRMKKDQKVWELARELNDLSYHLLKRGDKFCTLLMSVVMMRMLFRLKSVRMSGAALSFAGAVFLREKYGEIEVLGIHAFPSNFSVGPEFSALALMFDDRLCWDFLYLDSDMDRERAVVLAEEVRVILESAVKEEV